MEGGGLCAGTWLPWAQGTSKEERVSGGQSPHLPLLAGHTDGGLDYPQE